MATAKITDWDPQRYQEEERKTLPRLLDAVRKDEQLRALILNDDGEALKYLRARKNDVGRSLLLMRNHMSHRTHYSLDKLMPTEGPLRTELTSGKFTILDSRDGHLAQLLLFTVSKHHPSTDNNVTAIQCLVLQLDAAMSSEETQKNGVVLLVDMAGSGFANFDRRLSQSVLNLLQEGYPARLKMIFIIDAPWWFKTTMAFILPFLKKKTRDRIWSTSRSEVLRIFKSDSLPKQLGGDLDHDHFKWLQTCTDYYQVQQAKRASIENNTTVPTINTHLVHGTKSDMAALPGMVTPSKDDIPPSPPVRSSSTGKKPAPQRSPDRPPKRQHGVVPVEDAITPPLPDKPGSDTPPLPPKDLDIYSDEDRALTITGLDAFFNEKGREGLFKDYAVMRLEKPAGNFDTSSHPVNASKNRYADVLSLEHSRVKLTVIHEDDFSDYINANFVDSFKQAKAYIFTQGPLRNTYNDFWRMVWEQQTRIIVMTTKLWERGRMKCGQYWPDADKTVEYNDLTIINVEERVEQNYTVRVFILHKADDSRAVTQYQFTGWPDFGVPSSAQSLLKFLNDIHHLQDQHSQEIGVDKPLPPVVMHCSAGIGRTGTLGAIDIALQQLTATGKVNLEGIVRKMRYQRAYSIQTPEQYEFCFRAIIEWSKTSSEMNNQQ